MVKELARENQESRFLETETKVKALQKTRIHKRYFSPELSNWVKLAKVEQPWSESRRLKGQ